MAGMLVNNTLYKFDMLPRVGYLLDFVLGNSLLYFALIYICSITFGFCRWHRIIIAANLINLCFANINNNIAKFDSLLKLAQDDNGMVDIEGIINETADNLLVAQVKKYPEVLGGVEIGNGTIRVKIPLIDKVIELDTNDLTAFRETLTSK